MSPERSSHLPPGQQSSLPVNQKELRSQMAIFHEGTPKHESLAYKIIWAEYIEEQTKLFSKMLMEKQGTPKHEEMRYGTIEAGHLADQAELLSQKAMQQKGTPQYEETERKINVAGHLADQARFNSHMVMYPKDTPKHNEMKYKAIESGYLAGKAESNLGDLNWLLNQHAAKIAGCLAEMSTLQKYTKEWNGLKKAADYHRSAFNYHDKNSLKQNKEYII